MRLINRLRSYFSKVVSFVGGGSLVEQQADTAETIVFWRKYLSNPKLPSADLPPVLINLANALSDLADEEGDASHCDEAVELGERALRLIPEGTGPKQIILSDLSTIFLTRFELKGSLNDLQRSRDLIEEATRDTEPEHESRCIRYANFSNTLCTAFDAFGRDADLQDAVAAGQTAVSAGRAEVNARAKALTNQGRALQLRYERYHILSDLEEAVSNIQEAVALATDSLTKNTCRVNYVGHLLTLAERDPSDEMLDRALKEGQALLFDLDGPLEAMLAHNMSYLLRLKYEREDKSTGEAVFGSPLHLYQALEYAVLAAKNTKGSEASRAMYMDQFALCLLHAYKFVSITPYLLPGGDSASPLEPASYLGLAVHEARNAVTLLPNDHPAAASYTNHLVELLLARREIGDVAEALSLSVSVFDQENAPSLVRIAAGQKSGIIHGGLGQWDAASRSFEQAVDLVQDLARESLQRRDQQFVLSQITGLSQMAASAALQAGRSAAEAFSTLERGRSVLSELAITSRADNLPGLLHDGEARPLIDRYRELKLTLATGYATGKMTAGVREITTTAATSIRLQALKELKTLELQISEMSENRVMAETSGEFAQDTLKFLANDYAVAFCTTAQRSDAFVLGNRGVESLLLPQLDAEALSTYARSLIGLDRITKIRIATYRHSNKQLRTLLKWLWSVAIHPVLAHLKLMNPSRNPSRLPRICWITSGLMGLMPLHAAGIHEAGSTDFTMNYVISSYAVSAQALYWCRRSMAVQRSRKIPERLAAAAITMRSTPGMPDLDFIDEELSALRSALPEVVDFKKPSAARVELLLPSINVAHFACHAEPDPNDPSAGSVLLFDEEKDAIDRLSIYALAEVDTSAAWLAYLSACQTADLQDMNLLDGVVHITGTFQIAGFTQVVGTLWQAEDEYAAIVAKTFYGDQNLRAAFRKPDEIHRDTAVVALHEAVMRARAEDPELVLSWAQFVVFGA